MKCNTILYLYRWSLNTFNTANFESLNLTLVTPSSICNDTILNQNNKEMVLNVRWCVPFPVKSKSEIKDHVWKRELLLYFPYITFRHIINNLAGILNMWTNRNLVWVVRNLKSVFHSFQLKWQLYFFKTYMNIYFTELF